MLLKYLQAVANQFKRKPKVTQSEWLLLYEKLLRHKDSIVAYASLPKYRYQRKLYTRFATLDVFYETLSAMIELLSNRRFVDAKVMNVKNINLTIALCSLDDYLLTKDRVYIKGTFLEEYLNKLLPLLKAVDALETDFDCKIIIDGGILNPFLEEAREVFKTLI